MKYFRESYEYKDIFDKSTSHIKHYLNKHFLPLRFMKNWDSVLRVKLLLQQVWLSILKQFIQLLSRQIMGIRHSVVICVRISQTHRVLWKDSLLWFHILTEHISLDVTDRMMSAVRGGAAWRTAGSRECLPPRSRNESERNSFLQKRHDWFSLIQSKFVSACSSKELITDTVSANI